MHPDLKNMIIEIIKFLSIKVLDVIGLFSLVLINCAYNLVAV